MKYVWSVAGADTPLDTESDLEARLEEVAQRQHADWAVLLNEEGVKPSWVYRLLGVRTPVTQEGVLVTVNGEDASLIYVDQDWHETRVLDPRRASLAGDVGLILSGGDDVTVRRRETVSRQDAIDAVRRFRAGQARRPDFVYKVTEE